MPRVLLQVVEASLQDCCYAASGNHTHLEQLFKAMTISVGKESIGDCSEVYVCHLYNAVSFKRNYTIFIETAIL